MTEAEERTRRLDAHALLGSAAHFIRRLASGDVLTGGELDATIRRMAQEWSDGYARYQNVERPAIAWLTVTMPASETTATQEEVPHA